ncbi:MAG TPA: hypothetical protein VHK27_03215 [Gammaproteobacteria bacterium]|nr:hypothetical protein [Gammaproteobacteria bacterium]
MRYTWIDDILDWWFGTRYDLIDVTCTTCDSHISLEHGKFRKKSVKKITNMFVELFPHGNTDCTNTNVKLIIEEKKENL